ncbi:MAG: carboxypeptidase regulatory-like domain-containing protein [Myxococcales bacterium]|nr:carboxypeptidase regulatory-like domain-containing protein [Myxococcales bacterium]
MPPGTRATPLLALAALIGGAAALGACRPSAPDVAPARVRVIETPQELLWGPAATGAIGDYMLDNGLVLAVISHDAATSGFAASAGNLVDLAPLPDGEDHLNEVFMYLDDEFPRQATYSAIKVIEKGGGKKAARVRAIGVDTGNDHLKVETDYILEPGARWITLETRVTNTASITYPKYEIGDAVQWGRTEHMAPGQGFDLPGRRVNVDWLGGIGKDTSYAFVPDGPGRFDTFNGSMWSDPIGMVADLPPNTPVTYRRHVVVGRGDTASFAADVAKLRGDRTGRLTGRVTHGGEPVREAKVWVIAADTDKIAGLARVDKDGWYSIDLAPGRYRARAEAPGRTSVSNGDGDRVVSAGGSETMSFAMGAEGTVAWRIEGDDGRAPPVKVAVLGRGDTPAPRLGPSFRADGAEQYVLSARGVGEIKLSPGSYEVVVSRGPEYEIIRKQVEVSAGSTEVVQGKLQRSVVTPGLISTDLHQHAAPSFDSGVSLPDRALSNAAEGVEVLVATDHNALTDFRPVIASQGLGRVVYSVVATEATTHSVGHFNALPLQLQPGKPRGGMVDVEGWTPRQIFDFVRGLAAPGDETFIQVNHPRAGKTGYFDLMKVDPKTGKAADPRYISDFDGVEVVVMGKHDETARAMEDWFNILRQGNRVTGTGTSDSHTISLRPVGWPRTYVCVDDDAPPRLDVAAFTHSLREGCATVSNGPVITMHSGETRMGGLAPAPTGELTVDIQVQAAGWIGTDRILLYVDGKVAEEIPIPPERTPVRYTGRHTVRCKSDCFVVAWVDSNESLEPVIARRQHIYPLPVAVTNPIYVDVDGDGRYGPPGAKR